ncbi:hypothetical protein O181_129565 [Austropuccinia psidii MF-1]|uniref:Uncharacterized protein n=1 Tax=Austropuccinia psidii MF-1 TaxID=1389203 RepID=A0A9Q3QA35_9BASI|nr:hypothetical protein [Austropuccinia psidii MF-1]
MASGHILSSLAFLANSHFSNPWACGVILSSRGLQAPSHHPWIQGHPFHYWGFGLNGLFGPFRPPTASTVRMVRKLRSISHGPQSVGHLGPFWPNPMRPKGASQVGPKPQLGPPEPFFTTTSLDPKVTKNLMDTIVAINPVGPNFGHGPPWTNSSAMASGNHHRPPD